MTDITARPAPHFLSQLAQTFSVGNHRLFIAMAVLALAPLWFGQNLPMVDMPQHGAQITALREIWAGNETFTGSFEVNWFTPYLLGYVLLYVGALVMPVAVATQLLVSCALLAIPLLTASLLRAAGADERWKWLAIPCSFGFAFYWGFLSFLVAAPLGLWFLIASIRFANAPTLARGLAMAAFSIALFFCHVIVLGFASLIALGYIFGRYYNDLKGLAVRALPYAAPLPIVVTWMLATYNNVDRVRNDPVVFGPLSQRLFGLLTQPAGQDGVHWFACLLVTGAVALLPALMGSRFSRRPERWLPFALGLLAYMSAPHFVFAAAYFYQRLGLFIVPLWLLCWDPPAEQTTRRPDWLAIPVVALWLFMNVGRFAAFARETESFDAILGSMEPGRRVASLLVDKGSPLFTFPVYMHFPARYQAEKAGIVDFNFAEFYSQMARYKKDEGPRISERVTWLPMAFDWQANGGDKYDYFLIKANADFSGAIFKDKREAVELVARSEWWWLYRNKERFAAESTVPAVN